MLVRMRSRVVRDVGGAYLVYDEDGSYEAPIMEGEAWVRRGWAHPLDSTPALDLATPTRVSKRGLAYDARIPYEEDLMHTKAPLNRMLEGAPRSRAPAPEPSLGTASTQPEALTFRELQQALKARGLSAAGPRHELLARLRGASS